MIAAQIRKTTRAKADEAIRQSFETQLASDGLTGAWSIVSNSNNRQQARNDFFEWAGNRAKSGSLSTSDFVTISNIPVTIGNQTKSIKEWYGGTDEFTELQSDFDSGYRRDKEVQSRWIQERERQAKAAEYELADYLTSQPNLSEADIDKAQEELQKQFPGYKSSRLDNINTVDDRLLATQRTEVESMAKDGTLTLEKLSKFDYRVFNEFQYVANRNSSANKATNAFKPQKDAIKELVKSQPFVMIKGAGDGGYTIPLKTAELTRKFEKRRAELQEQYPAKDPVDIANEAVHQVREEFFKQINDPAYQASAKTQLGYPDMLDPTIDTEKEAIRANQRLGAIQGNLAALGGRALQNTGLIVNEAEATNIIKSYGEPGWKPSANVKYTADILGITEVQVINSQLQALNENTGTKHQMLGEPPSIDAINSNVPADVRNILQKYQSSDRSVRGLGQSNTFMPEVIPHGYGEYFVESSARHGVPASDLAALAEVESTFKANAVSPTGAWGIMQIQGDMHPEYTGGADPQANIDYGAKYYSELVQEFGDPAIAAGAYNAGPGRMREHLETGRPLPAETVEHMKRFKKAQYKYGKTEVLQDPQVMRSSSPVAVYITGNIGPTSTGPHLDVKKVGGGRFEETALDDYVEVEDPDFGRVSLGDLRQRTGGVGDSWDEHNARGSHGIDYGTHSGTPVYVKNGAKLIGSQPSEHGDVVTIELPSGEQYTFLHGNKT